MTTSFSCVQAFEPQPLNLHFSKLFSSPVHSRPSIHIAPVPGLFDIRVVPPLQTKAEYIIYLTILGKYSTGEILNDFLIFLNISNLSQRMTKATERLVRTAMTQISLRIYADLR